MKKILTLFLVLLLIFSLTACDMVGELLPSGGDRTPAAGQQQKDPDSSGKKMTQQQREAALAALDNYWDKLRLEWEWDQQDAEGYVWTITIDSVSVLDVAGLASVEYALDLSCSHVGPTMDGVYSGEMAMEYAADLSGVMALVTFAGGSASYDADGWFENDQFVMRLVEYDDLVETQFDSMMSAGLQAGLSGEEQAIADAFLGMLLGGVGSGDEAFETAGQPASAWYDWDFHMTDGDMSGYVNMTGIVGGIASASGTVDASGTQSQGDAYASVFGMTFTERYDETIENPFPYALRVYETGEVVFELYSSSGGPVTVKFYGTIDRIPVGDTQLIPN